MWEPLEILPAPLQIVITKVGEALAGAVTEVAMEAGAKSVFTLLSRGERREVARGFTTAIVVTLQDYPELNEISFARWLESTPVRDLFLEVLSKPALDPDHATVSRLLEGSAFDPDTFPVDIGQIVISLRDNFLAALYGNTKTRSIFNAIVLHEHLEAHRLMLNYQRRAHSALERIETAVTNHAVVKPARRGKPFSAPNLPAGFVQRPAIFEQLESRLLNQRSGSVATTTALQGAGGFGKTTLAIALCHDAGIRKKFKDGILWVELGETPNLQRKLAEIYSVLTGKQPRFLDATGAAIAVAQELENKRCLLVIDDVWRPEHLRPFLRGGPHCVRLVTTRHMHIVGDALPLRVDEMTTAEAVEVLASKLRTSGHYREELSRLARRLGEWPLLLDLTGSTLRNRVRLGDTMEGAIAFVERQLDRYGPAAFDLRNTTERAMAVALTVDLSLKQLEISQERQNLLELSIFPEDLAIPLSVISQLWNLNHPETDELLFRMDDLALLRYNPHATTVRLHDVMRSYFGAKLREEGDPPAAHMRLLHAWANLYMPSVPESRVASLLVNSELEWWKLPADEAFAWAGLAWHLVAAGHTQPLRNLLFDCRWLEAKLRIAGLPATLSDFAMLPVQDEELLLLLGALQLSAHVLSVHPNQVRSQLIGRLLGRLDSSRIQVMLSNASTGMGDPWLRPTAGSLIPPTGALLRTLVGHSADVASIVVTPDGARAVSGAGDGIIKVWNLRTGVEERTLGPHGTWIWALAVTPDGERAVSASDDGTLKIWNLRTGQGERTLVGHTGEVRTVAMTPDGRSVVSGSDDQSLKIWDVATGQETRTCWGHAAGVRAIVVTPDGQRIVSGSYDGRLIVWNLETGTEVRALGEEEYAGVVLSLAVTCDGQHVVCGSFDGTLSVWNLESGEEERTFVAHSSEVRGVAVTPDALRSVSASHDLTLKVWIVATGANERTLVGHTAGVRAVALTPDGHRALSASDDETIKVWDLTRPVEDRMPSGHTSSLTAIAITPDGRRVVSASKDELKTWNFETGEPEFTLEGHHHRVNSVAVTRDGQVVYTCSDHEIMRWNLETRESERLETRSGARAVGIMPDGRSLVTRSIWGDGLTVWNEAGEKSEYPLHASGRLVVAVTQRGLRTIYRTGKGLVIQDLEADGDNDVAWNPRKPVERVREVHSGVVSATTMTPNGSRAVSGTENGTFSVWDLETGVEEHVLAGHMAEIRDVAITADGRRAVSVSSDRSLNVWELDTGQQYTPFTADGALQCCAIAEDGHRIVAGDQFGGIHFLSLEGLRGINA